MGAISPLVFSSGEVIKSRVVLCITQGGSSIASHAGVVKGARISSLPYFFRPGEGRNTSFSKNALMGG